MNKTRARQPLALQPVEPLPSPTAPSFLAATTNHPQPHSADLGVNLARGLHVARYRIVIREPTNDTCQPYTYVPHRVVHPFDQLLLDLFKLPTKTLSDGNAADAESAPPGNTTDMCEA